MNVDDELLDVIFVDGTCASVSDGCDDNSDFFFAGDALGAFYAAGALLDRVMINTADPRCPLFDAFSFDLKPSSTTGCNTAGVCFLATIAIFGLGLLGLGVARRQKKQAA